MWMVMDIGNTRTKWALANVNGSLQETQVCLNADLAKSELKRTLKMVQRVLVANVAGAQMAESVVALASQNVQFDFIRAQPQACGVLNQYRQPETLGADRWAALIAAWHMHKQPTVVVSAGTAVTIDALARQAGTKQGVFIGGTIMPGLRLMRHALGDHAEQLKAAPNGALAAFPASTQDAMETGCLNAVIGAVLVMLQQLEKHSAYLPKLVLCGGDANKVAEALKPHIKRGIIVENLVLQGLVLLGEEGV